jgi:hypothetical protein
MATVTREQAEQLVAEINEIWSGAASVKGGYDGLALKVEVRIKHPATGNSAMWSSFHADAVPSAAQIVQALKSELGIAARRTRRAIRGERGAS